MSTTPMKSPVATPPSLSNADSATAAPAQPAENWYQKIMDRADRASVDRMAAAVARLKAEGKIPVKG